MSAKGDFPNGQPVAIGPGGWALLLLSVLAGFLVLVLLPALTDWTEFTITFFAGPSAPASPSALP